MKKSLFLVGLTALAFGNLAHQTAWADEIQTQYTPDGVARMVQPDDSILSPAPMSPKFPALVKPDAALVQSIVQFADEILTDLSVKTDEKDTQYYENGIWNSPSQKTPGGWLYGAGPAGLAAQLWKWRQAHFNTLDDAAKARQPWLQKVAVETFDRLLKDHQKPDGDFSDMGNDHREFFTIDLITTYLIFKDTLDAPTRQRWLSAMISQVDWMIKTGDLPDASKPLWKATDGWYANGNVEISEVEWLYLVWQATGDQKYKDLMELGWKHALNPTPTRWKGYGLFYLKPATKADGSDGSAYVTEAAGAPGFDREYAQLQLSMVSRYYLKSRDPRALKLSNLILNSLLPHVDKDTQILDALYGSRHSTLPPFFSCAPAILAWMGGRSDLLPTLDVQFEKGVKPIMSRNAKLNEGAPGTYRSYGFDLAALIEAASEIDAATKLQ